MVYMREYRWEFADLSSMCRQHPFFAKAEPLKNLGPLIKAALQSKKK